MNQETNTYAQSFKKLEEINNKLQNGHNNPQIIDELATLLESASSNYNICKDKIDAAKKVISKFDQEKEA